MNILETINGRKNATPNATGVVQKIPLTQIDFDAEQPRKTIAPEALQVLANSLTTHGQLQPIRVRPGATAGRFVIVLGERRVRAARLAGFLTIEAAIVFSERATDELLRAQQIAENVIRQPLTPIETAHGYYDLMIKNGYTQDQLAKALAISQTTVSRALALLNPTPATPQRKRVSKKTRGYESVANPFGKGTIRLKRGATMAEFAAALVSQYGTTHLADGTTSNTEAA